MTSDMELHKTNFDVIVLGSGLAGSVLASCLARNGAEVLILDTDTHPRFAIGESTIPYTSMMMRLVSERYDVPEIIAVPILAGAASYLEWIDRETAV